MYKLTSLKNQQQQQNSSQTINGKEKKGDPFS
jgi:hypothetical protein